MTGLQPDPHAPPTPDQTPTAPPGLRERLVEYLTACPRAITAGCGCEACVNKVADDLLEVCGAGAPRPAPNEPFDVLGALKALFQSGSLTRRAEPWLHDAVRSAGEPPGVWGYEGPAGQTITPFGTLLPMHVDETDPDNDCGASG